VLTPSDIKRLKQKCDTLFSTSVFEFNLRSYNEEQEQQPPMGYDYGDEEPEPVWCEERHLQQPMGYDYYEQRQPMGFHYEQQQPMRYDHYEPQESMGAAASAAAIAAYIGLPDTVPAWEEAGACTRPPISATEPLLSLKLHAPTQACYDQYRIVDERMPLA